MNCRKVRAYLSAYIDAELRGHEHQLVGAHLRTCSSCREEYERLLQVKRLLGRMPVRDCAPDLASRISQYARVRTPLLHPGFGEMLTDRSIALLKMAGAGAALTLAALLWWHNVGAAQSQRIVFQQGGTVMYDLPAPARSESDLTGPGMDVSLLELGPPMADMPNSVPSTGADTPWATDEIPIATQPASRHRHSTIVWKRIAPGH
ncbi:MAG: zf-HC2 domain-containing protein [Armatimonadetes bacterium]|nr:zf-HC2 domain-containing protein [Armatimonadota bacterium]MDE2207032.1 zf-HC2 domain-containing protein [Armatimonadota bacterium]